MVRLLASIAYGETPLDTLSILHLERQKRERQRRKQEIEYKKKTDAKGCEFKYLPKNVRERFTSDFRYITNILCEGEILDEDKVKELVHPVETLDMLISYTNDIRYKNIRKRILTKTMEGEKISMGNFLDELDRKNTIDNARRYHMKGVSDEIIVETISEELNIDITEAREIFNNEVKKTA